MPHQRRRVIDPTDPQDLAVQIQLRVPFWYREQLMREAHDLGVSLPNLLVDAVQRIYNPKRPSKTA